MKRYVNKTRTQKRIVFITDKKAGTRKTYFLRSGQEIVTSDVPEFVDEGIKVRDQVKTKTTTKVEGE